MKKYEQLTWSYLKQNKKRTFSTMFGVAFGAFLVFAIVSIAFCQIEKSLRNAEDIYKFDAVFYDLSEEQATMIESYPGVKTFYGGTAHPVFFQQYGLVLVDDFDENPYGICLIEGHYPNDSHEILLNVTAESDYEIGDTVYVGPSVQTQLKEPIEFVIVGTFVYDGKYSELSTYEYSYVSLMGLSDEAIYQQVKDANAIFVKYRNPYVTKKLSQEISRKTEADYFINDSVALYYNQSSDGSMQGIVAAIVLSLVILLSWMMVAVIRNTLRISVAERIKDYGVLRCAGASLKQLKKMVMQEALIVGIISGTVGPMTAYVGLVIFSANSEQFDFSHFYLLAFVFTIFVVLINMLLATSGPCNMLTKMTPIEAVKNQVKTSTKKTYKVRKAKLITKVFGIEGAYAYKNAMRNPRQFMTTVFSLVIGIILFICTETLYETVLNYYLPDDLLNYYNVVALDQSDIYDRIYEEDIYTSYRQNMALAKTELKALDEVGKTLDEIMIASYQHYMEAYYFDGTDFSTLLQDEKHWKVSYPEDESDMEYLLRYAGISALRTERIFGYEPEKLLEFKDVLLDGTCDPKELGEDGIILYNYHTVEHGASVGVSMSGVVNIEIEEDETTEIYDYKIGDKLTFVTAPYEELERRIREKEAYYYSIMDSDEVLRQAQDYQIVRLCYFEVYKDLYEEGYYKTYTIKGIVSKDPLLLSHDYNNGPHYIMTKEQMQELFPGHEGLAHLAMHADGYNKDVTDILEKYELSSHYQYYMSLYQLCDSIRNFFDMIMVVVLIFMTINIFNTISNNMVFRKQEFALLRCVGISKKKLMYMIMLEGLMAVIIATVVGGSLGVLLCFGIYLYCSVFMKGLSVVYISLIRLFSVVLLLFGILFLASWIPMQSIKKEIAPELAQADE